MPQIILILALALAGVLALFGVQNTEAVVVHVLWFPARSMPLSLAIVGGAVLGALLSILAGLPARFRRGPAGAAPHGSTATRSREARGDAAPAC